MRRDLPTLIALLAGLVVGGLAVWMLRPPREQLAAPADHAQQEASVPVPGDNTPARLEVPKPAPDAQPDSDKRTPVVPPQVGAGFIRGLVSWADGAACAGLPLVAELHDPGAIGVNNARGMTPQRRNELYQRMVDEVASNTCKATTGADGRFEIAGIGEGKYRLVSADRDIVVSQAGKASGLVEAGADVKLSARRAIYIQFELTLAGGERLQKAIVWLSHSNGQLNNADRRWWPGREYLVEPRKWKVSVTDTPEGLWKSETEIDVPPEGLALPVKVELQRESCLVVRCKFNEPHYAADVFLVSTDTLSGAKGMTPDELTREIAKRRRSWGGGRQNPQIVRDLTPGRYTVFIMIGRSAILASKEVDYRGGYQEVEIELPDPARDDNIVLRVLGPDGTPLDGARVSVWVDPGNTAQTALERGGGEYWIKRIPPANLTWNGVTQKTEYGISVTHPSYGTLVITCPFDARNEQVVKFAGKCVLTVVLDNLPAERGNIELAAFAKGAAEERAFDMYNSSLLAKESADFDMAAGPVVVVLRISPGPSQAYSASAILWREEIELAPGKRVLRINVPQLGGLRLRVPQEIDAALVTIRKDSLQRTVRPDAAGIIEIAQLPSGSYQVSCEAGSMTVELPVFSEVVLNVQPYNALRVAYLDPGGALQQLGLKAGDVIRQVNGVPLNGSNTAIVDALKRAADSSDVTLLVQRAAQSLTFTGTQAQWKSISQTGLVAARVD